MLMLCLLSIHCCLCSEVLRYYISPHLTINKTCAHSYAVAPCYTLHELCDNQQLLLNKASVELFLLPGRHVISNQTFSAIDIEELVIHPWEEGEMVEVECVMQGRFMVARVKNLSVYSLMFTGCIWAYKMNLTDSSTDTALVNRYNYVNDSRIDINGCIFTQSLTVLHSI